MCREHAKHDKPKCSKNRKALPLSLMPAARTVTRGKPKQKYRGRTKKTPAGRRSQNHVDGEVRLFVSGFQAGFVSRAFCIYVAINKLDNRHGRHVTITEARFQNPHIAALALCVAWAKHVK